MSNINKDAVLNPFSDLTANILNYVPRATTSEFGIVAIGSGINVDVLGRIYLDTQEYSDRLSAIEAQAASSLATQKSEVAAAIAQVNLTQSQTISALTLEVNNLKTSLTDSITATQTDLINRADQLAQDVTDITVQLTQDKATFTQDIQDALDFLKDDASVASALRTPRKIQGVDFDGTQDISLPTFTTQTDGLVPKRVGATSTKYLREDGTWVVPTNTTYALLTTVNAEDGTATTANSISAKVLKEAIQYHAPTVTNNAGTTGNAATATKLQTPRTISLTGKVTGSVSFDGSANAAISTVITGLGAANGIATLDSSGQVPSTQLPSYVDDVLEYANIAAFPTTGETGKIYVETTGNTTYRWGGTAYVKITSGEVSSVAGKTGVVTLSKADVGLTNVDNTADSAKSVASASKLTTARTIGGVSFDGSANVNLPGVNTSGNQNTSGNAATATKLATARTIGGVSFDGTAAINLPGVNTTGNQNTSGNAATTTKLQTARTIAISGAVTGTATSFDGSANIAIATTTIDGSKISTGTIPAARIPTLNQSTTGNAATATKLGTPVKINGTDFDGTQDINIASMPMGVPIFHSGLRSTIETGYVAYDGQLLNRADHPAMWAKVQATFPIITDADWLANPSKRGSYSSGDGTTTFRMPDYNGVQTNSLKGLFLRGDGGGTIGGVAVSSGTTVLSDAIRNITGGVADNYGGINMDAYGAFSGTFSSLTSYGTTGNGKWGPFNFDASRQVPTAAENRPVSAVGVWICRVGNTLTEVVNPTLHAVLTGGNTFSGTQKMEAVEFNDSTVIRGLVNDLTTGGIDKALTAEKGKALADSAFGVNQTLFTMTGLRSLGITYTNSTNKPIFVSVTGITTTNFPSTVLYANVNEVAYARLAQVQGAWASISFIVPPSGTYLVNVESNVGFSLQIWKEFKA